MLNGLFDQDRRRKSISYFLVKTDAQVTSSRLQDRLILHLKHSKKNPSKQDFGRSGNNELYGLIYRAVWIFQLTFQNVALLGKAQQLSMRNYFSFPL